MQDESVKEYIRERNSKGGKSWWASLTEEERRERINLIVESHKRKAAERKQAK